MRRELQEIDPPQPIALGLFFTFCMTVVCFGVPYAYLRHINEFFITGVGRTDTITERWQSFVDENVADWTNTNLVVSTDLFEYGRITNDDGNLLSFSFIRRPCW